MNKENFTSKLIGRDEATIKRKIESWEFAVRELNRLAQSWKDYFGEPLTPDMVTGFLRTNAIENLIKSHYVLIQDNERAQLAREGKYKVENLIDETVIPPFNQLKNEIKSFLGDLRFKKFIDELEENIDELFNGDEYVFPDEMRKRIETAHTYYTVNEIENEALKIIQNVCDAFNQFNQVGGDVYPQDLPRPFNSYIMNIDGKKTFAELNSGLSDNPNWPVPQLQPFWGVFKGDKNTLLNLVSANYFID